MWGRTDRAGAIAALIVLASAASAQATTAEATASSSSFVASERYIQERVPTLAPMGYVLFCAKNPVHCGLQDEVTALPTLTAQHLDTLRSVNVEINSSINQQNDRTIGAIKDEWQIARSAGDCEDFVLAKRARLLQIGWPAGTLRIAVARTPTGEGHAVLVVRTAAGDIVLDNRNNAILPWQHANLRWVKIQSGSNPRRWFKI